MPGEENKGPYRLEIINPWKGSRIYSYFQESISANISVCQLELRVCVRKDVVQIRGRLRLKCEGTRAKTRFRLSTKRASPFKSAEASVQSTTGSRGVCISGSNGSNAGYTMFPSRASRCVITFQLDSTCIYWGKLIAHIHPLATFLVHRIFSL
jgi:hypothetical protein